jgi:hypothetical protein
MPQVINLTEVTQQLRKGFDALVGKEVARCSYLSINKTLSADRVFIGKQIRKEYNMNVFDAKSQIVQTNASASKLWGTLSGNAGFTPFEYFKVSAKSNISGQVTKLKRSATRYAMINGKKTIVGRSTSLADSGRHSTFTVSITKNKSSLFTHAFIANTKNGPMLFNRGQYTSRTNQFGSISPRNPMERLRTLSVWQEMTSRNIMGKSEILLRTEYQREFTRLMGVTLSAKGWK